MILGFKDRFVPLVEDGSKTHTIRAGFRWKLGMRADLFSRPRQKDMRLLFRAPVVKVERIQIVEYGHGAPGVWINDIPLSDDECDAFAFRDGFRRVDLRPQGAAQSWGCFFEMMRFWAGRLPFDGQIIHWDYARRRMTKEEPNSAAYELGYAIGRAFAATTGPR